MFCLAIYPWFEGVCLELTSSWPPAREDGWLRAAGFTSLPVAAAGCRGLPLAAAGEFRDPLFLSTLPSNMLTVAGH